MHNVLLLDLDEALSAVDFQNEVDHIKGGRWWSKGVPPDDDGAANEAPAANEQTETTNISHIEFMDDLALYILSPDLEGYGTKLRLLINTVGRIAAEHAIVINWAPGKTELLVMPRGTGSRSWRSENVVDNFLVNSEPKCPITTLYTHVGTSISAGSQGGAAAQYRTTCGRKALGKIGKLLLRRGRQSRSAHGSR